MNGDTRKFGLRIVGMILVMAALLIGGLSITRAAAQGAIPGDALYPVKTTIEQTRLSLAQDAGDRAQMKLSFAEQRLGEIGALIEEGRYHLVGDAVLAFEADINSAILELETIAEMDPARATRIALEITAALTRYAQTLSVMAANAPEGVQQDVARALDTTQIVAGLELPASDAGIDSDSNSNDDDGSANDNENEANENDNLNDNGDDDDNGNANANANDNGDDDNGNMNDNDDDRNQNGDGDNANENGDDDDDNGNMNDNGDDNDNDDDNGNMNDNGDDDDDDNGNMNDNGDDDDDNANNNGDDGDNDNDDDSNSNDNGNGDDDDVEDDEGGDD